MLPYSKKPTKIIKHEGTDIPSFLLEKEDNLDRNTVASFGDEWTKFGHFSYEEISTAGDQYFDIVTNEMCHKDSLVLDLGCGTGRWSYYLSDKVKFIEAIDPSKSVLSASELTKDLGNVRVTQAAVGSIPFEDHCFDFAMGIGVYHHIPDTYKAISDTIKKLKVGGHFLIYLYYDLDNRSKLYKVLFGAVNLFRVLVSSLPKRLKKFACECIALFIYLPMVIFSRCLKWFKASEAFLKKIPLSYYADKSWKIIRNDALDRFGTPLEQRFSKKELIGLLESCGLDNIVVSPGMPYWHAVGRKSD